MSYIDASQNIKALVHFLILLILDAFFILHHFHFFSFVILLIFWLTSVNNSHYIQSSNLYT